MMKPMDEIPKSRPKIGLLVLIAILILTVGFWAANRFLLITKISLMLRAPVEKKFMMAWDDDLKRLASKKILPSGFDDLKKIKFYSTSENLKKTFSKYPLDFKTKLNGHFELEIFADTIDDGGVVVQYDLVNIKSGNTVWEMGRTFPHHVAASVNHDSHN